MFAKAASAVLPFAPSVAAHLDHPEQFTKASGRNTDFCLAVIAHENSGMNLADKESQLKQTQAREAMDRFKAASEAGVNLANGHLTSREAGSVGGQIARKMGPVRTARYERYNLIATGHV